MAERTLIIVKPDAVQRHLIGRIIARFEEKGLQLVAAKLLQISEDEVRQHYAAHKGKPFFEPAVKFMSTAPSLVMIWQGEGVINMARKMIGTTLGFEAAAGTIRGDFGRSERYNLIHGSDSPEAAEKEIEMFFASDEILDYEFSDANWLYVQGDSPKK
ncbi:MAG: nucleoside diphosphate kinase [Phycisphaerae bacterium SG8_4]|nr:MAG: nucleoside diphosphate kinase [Phycisphaerae bacterium SG8_4]